MTSFRKKLKKFIISLLLVLEWFFRNKNIMIVMIIRYTSKWGVAWPFLHYYLENGQFDHFIRNYIRTSGSMICWSQKYYICNKCNKCFNLRYHLVHLLPIYLFRIMTVRDEKCFWPYHVTYQPIDIKRIQNPSATPRWVIRAQLRINSTKTLQMVLCGHFWPSVNFLTFW